MAGVYIKDIEMPTNDEMLVIIKSNGEVKYKKSVESMWNLTTSVPVPKHGKLIDADELCEFYSHKDKLGNDYTAYHFIESINNCPPIIEGDDKE